MTEHREEPSTPHFSSTPCTHVCFQAERIARIEEAICWLKKRSMANLVMMAATVISTMATLILIIVKLFLMG